MTGEPQPEPRSVLAIAYDNTGAKTSLVVRVDTGGHGPSRRPGGGPGRPAGAASPGGVQATLTVGADRRT